MPALIYTRAGRRVEHLDAHGVDGRREHGAAQAGGMQPSCGCFRRGRHGAEFRSQDCERGRRESLRQIRCRASEPASWLNDASWALSRMCLVQVSDSVDGATRLTEAVHFRSKGVILLEGLLRFT